MAPLTDLENLSGSTLNLHDANYSVDPVAEKRLLWRMDIRIMPMAIMMFFLSFIDRANIGNAKVLNADVNHSFVQSLHVTDSQYRIAVLVLMITYALFDIPSSYLLKRFRPSRWLSFLMFVWGGLTMILGAVNSFPGAVAIRILLGVFEAGLLPGLIYFLTFWYSPWERALRIALILSSAPLSGAVGGLLAYAIGHMDEVRGLEGWRWLFILEGIPSCLCAFAVFFFFPDFPETAQWLTSAERELATKRLRGECSVGHAHISWDDVRATLSDARLYLHYIKGLLLGVTLSSTSVFGPSIMAGLGYKGLAAQLFTVPPLVVTFVLMIPAGWVADRYGIRAIVGMIGMSVAALAFLAQGFVEPTAVHLRYGLFTVSIAFSTAASPPMLSWLTGNLRSTSAATFAVPLNVAAVAIGQIIGVYIYMAREAPGYQTGHYINGICCLLNAAIAAVLRLIYVRRNRTLSKGERRWHL